MLLQHVKQVTGLLTTTATTILSRRVAVVTASYSTSVDIRPPKRRHRDVASVLRALGSCVDASLGLPDYRSAYEPWLGSGAQLRTHLLAKAAGRNAARQVARQFLANDITALVTETPRINSLVPLQTGESIRQELAEGQITPEEAMRRLLLLLAPRDAWALYKDFPDTKWDSDTLHRLLDLLCATNSGSGGSGFMENLPFIDRGSLPDPDEIFFAQESLIINDLKARPPVHPAEELIAAKRVEEEADEHGEKSITDADADKQPEVDEVPGASPSSWYAGCPAERLWQAYPDVLRTPAAYCAMIRGAARFEGCERACELAEEATSLQLSLAAYNALLRCASDWSEVQRYLQVIEAKKLAPTTDTFASALYALAKACSKRLADNGLPLDYADKALALMEEAKSLGIEPSLGMYANLLRTLMDSRIQRHMVGYRVTDVLADIISTLEKRWGTFGKAPTIADIFTGDDYDFASAAMFCATADSSPASVHMAQRVYNLLHKNGDRRFLLANSLESRNFYGRYLGVVIRQPNESLLEGMERLRTIYTQHRQVVQSSHRIYSPLLNKLKSAVVVWSDLFDKQFLANPLGPPQIDFAALLQPQSANSMAFSLMGEMLFDYVTMSTRLPIKLPAHISDTVMAFARVDAWSQFRVLGQPVPFCAISVEGAISAGRAAQAILELISLQEPRLGPIAFPLNHAELAAAIHMALLQTAATAESGVGEREAEQSVSRREANERAVTVATDLLMVGQRHGRTTDTGALDILKSCWLTGGKQINERVWVILEYLSGLNYLTAHFLQDAFVAENGQFGVILDRAEKSLLMATTPRTEARGMSGGGRTPAETDAFNRLEIIRALRRSTSKQSTGRK